MSFLQNRSDYIYQNQLFLNSDLFSQTQYQKYQLQMQADSLADRLRKQRPNFSDKQIKKCLALDEKGTMKTLLSKLDAQQFELKKLQQRQQSYSGSIIDELIGNNLLQSFEASCVQHPDAVYSKDQMEKFRKDLLEKVREFKIQSQELLQELKQPLKSQDFYTKILNIRAKLHPVFVPDLIEIINRSSNTVKGKDIAAIFGNTGAGKTTISQILLGYNLHQVVGANGLITLQPKEDIRQQHRQFVSNAQSRSATKYVTAALLNLLDRQHGQIYLADTPGFNDSEGALVDAANSLATMRVLTGTNSIRFIFVINEKNIGTRMEGIKKLIKLITTIFKVYDKSKVIYFLNKFSQDQVKEMVKQVNNLISEGLNSEEKGIPNFLEVINHLSEMLNKAAKDAKNKQISIIEATKKVMQLVVINPLDPDTEQIYKKITRESVVVTNPRQALVNMVSESAMKSLWSQTQKLQSIINALTTKEQIAAVAYYLKQLKDYGEFTKTNDIAKANAKYENIVQKLHQKYGQDLAQFRIDINGKILSCQSNEKVFEEAHTLKQSLQTVTQRFKCLDEDAKFQYQKQIDEIVETASEVLRGKIAQVPRNPRLTQTIRLFSKYFKTSVASDLNQIIQKEQGAINSQLKAAVEQQNYVKLADLLCQIKSAGESNNNMSFDWENAMNSKTKERMDKLAEIYNRTEPMLLKPNQIEYTKKSIEIYSLEINSGNVKIVGLARHADEIKKIVINYAMKCKTNYQKSIQSLESKSHPPKLDLVDEPVKVLQQLVKIQLVSQQIQTIIRQVDDISVTKIQKYLQKNVEVGSFCLMENHQDADKLNKIFVFFIKLRNFSKIICNPNKLTITYEHITKSQRQVSDLIKSFYDDQISKLQFQPKNIKEAVADKLQRSCIILSAVLKEVNKKEQITENVIANQCLQMRNRMKEKLTAMIGKMSKYIDEMMKRNSFQFLSQNTTKHMKDFQQMLKILKKIDSTPFKVLQMSSNTKQINSQFNNGLANIVLNLNGQIENKLKQFYDFFQNIEVYDQPLKAKTVQQFEAKKVLLNKFNEIQDFAEIIRSNQQTGIQQKLDEIDERMKKLQKFALERYEAVVISEEKYYFQSMFVQMCKNLKFDCVTTMKEQFQKHITIDLSLKIDDLVRNSGNFEKAKQYYKIYLKFGKNTTYVNKRDEIKRKLKDIISNDVRSIESQIKSIWLKKEDNMTKIQQFIQNLRNLLQKIKQMRLIITDDPEIFNISPQTKIKIHTKITEIVNSYQKRLDDATEPSSKLSKQKYQELIQDYQKRILGELDSVQMVQIQQLVRTKNKNFQNCGVQQYYNRMSIKKKEEYIAKQEAIAIQKIAKQKLISEQQAIAKKQAKEKQQALIMQQAKAKQQAIAKQTKQPQNIQKDQKKSYQCVDQKIKSFQDTKIKPNKINQQECYNVEQVKQKDKELKINEKVASIHVNPKSNEIKPVRIVFLLSNTHLMEKIVKYFKKSLSRAIKQEKRACQFKIMFIRNYNSNKEHLFSQTKFEKEVKVLQQYLKSVKFMGGWDTLALEVPLHFINELSDVDQVITILRQRANTIDEVNKKMQMHGKQYWKNNGIPILSAEKQIDRLKQRKTPVHCLYENEEQYFKSLSQATKGISQKLVMGDKVDEQMVEFISARINQIIQKS